MQVSFAEIKESTQSNGDPYFYYVSDSPSTGSNNSGSGGSGGSDGAGGGSGDSGSGGDSSANTGAGAGGSGYDGSQAAAEQAALIAAMEAEAREAETALTEATKDYIERQEKVRDLQTILEKGRKVKTVNGTTIRVSLCEDEKSAVQNYINYQTSLLEQAYSDVSEKADATTAIYQSLGELYSQYETSGDPVKVSTGEYVLDYVDYKAQDFLDVFLVSRRLSNKNISGSFGYNWISSLDSRIIRSSFTSLDYEISGLTDIILQCNEIIDICDEYNSKYPNHPDDTLTEVGNIALEKKIFCTNRIEELRQLEVRNNLLIEKNKYTAYGQYYEDEFVGNENFLVLVDKEGLHYYLTFTNDHWEPMGALAASKFTLYSLNKYENVCTDIFAPGGYLLEYSDGKKMYYNEYGLLYKETDRNGNANIYENQNGKICAVTLKTGERISISRNNMGLVTKISGSVSGEAFYTYNSEQLTSVIDSDGVKVEYSYDDEGSLLCIKKADLSTVEISYEIKSGNKVCRSVKDENGNIENFSIDFSARTTKRMTSSGMMDYYVYDANGLIKYVKEASGLELYFNHNSLGLITAATKDNRTLYYEYDSAYRNIRIADANGTIQSYEYNNLGQVIKSVDADGFYNTFSYDAHGNLTASYFCGNLCGTYWYYDNGLLKGFSENSMSVELEYNKYGSITKKSERDSEGKSRSWSWEYDEKNRCTKFIEPSGDTTSISYDNNTKTIIEANKKKTVIKKDGRNRITSISETDLLRNIIYKKSQLYDGRGNITKVFLDDILFAQYAYTAEGKLQSYVIWNLPVTDQVARQGIVTDYSYDIYGRILSESKSSCGEAGSSGGSSGKKCITDSVLAIRSFEYSGARSGLTVAECFGSMEACHFTYDSCGRICRKAYPDGYVKEYVYSRAGRILSVRDNNYNILNYDYKSDGRVLLTQKNGGGQVLIYEYSPSGLLKNVRDSYGIIKRFYYSSDGLLTRKEEKSYNETFTYDVKGRLCAYNRLNNKGLSEYKYNVSYDSSSGLESYNNSGDVFCTKRRDAWNRIIEEQDLNGHYWYSYDVLGNCIRKSDEYGSETIVDYAPMGQPALIYENSMLKSEFLYDASGRLIEHKKNERIKERNSYDDSGHLLAKVNQYGGKKSFSYDKKGFYLQSTSYDTGSANFNRINSSSFSITDALGYSSLYNINENGLVASVVNSLGKKKQFYYDQMGRISQKKNFSGRIDNYTYNDSENSLSIQYGNGDKSFIVRNSLGLITKMKNAYSDFEYTYDLMGNLLEQYDCITDYTVSFQYDNYGRCINKKGNNFSIKYDYDNNGRLQRILDIRTGLWILFEYDKCSRIVKEVCSNGITTSIVYNKTGEKESVVSKDRSGQIISSDFIIYDSFGRIASVCNKNGDWTNYNYDNAARLVSVSSPFSESWYDFYKREAENCGFYIKENDWKDVKENLSASRRNAFKEIIDRAGCGTLVNPKAVQSVWTESYSYTTTGAISKIQNNLCSIYYEYDSLNQLKRKYADNTMSDGVVFLWDDDGCLVRMEGVLEKIDFSYGAELRPREIKYQNKANGEMSVFEYYYDALGRRYCSSYNRQDTHCFTYDGLSDSLLSYEALMQNGAIASKFYSHNKEYNGDYRLVDMNHYSEYGGVKTLSDSMSLNYQKSRSYYLVGASGTSNLLVYKDGFSQSGSDYSFLVRDFKGHCLTSSDDKAGSYNFMAYDVWGNFLEDNKMEAGDIKVSGGIMAFMENGFRDYNPFMKSFTTRDPAEFGMNLYAYCACDPVNYYDYSGFEKTAYTDSQNCLYAGAILQFTKFNQQGYLEGDLEKALGIHIVYDCADTSTCIDYLACLAAGLPMVSDLTKNFAALYEKNDFVASKETTSSAMYNAENGTTKTKDGYDRDLLRHNEFSKEERYITEAEKKKEVELYLTDPSLITPGTCLVWKNSDTPTAKSPNSCGHVATILSRQFDANGKVVGFILIQGHTGGGKTELNFMSTSDLVAGEKLDWYYGNFSGLFENENSKKAAEIAENNVVSESENKDSGCGK